MRGDEPLQIGKTAAGKMRASDAEMIQEFGEGCLDRWGLYGCGGDWPFSFGAGTGTNNAPRAIQDRSCSLRP